MRRATSAVSIRKLTAAQYCTAFSTGRLKVAGRLLVETDKGVEERLVTSVYDVVIPSLAIHHNPTVNEGVAFNTQSDTLPLFSQSEQELYSTLTDGSVLDADFVRNAVSEGV